jgi:excisionase family DNA binding protein
MSTLSEFSEPPLQSVSLVAAATILGCHTRTVRRYIADGRLTGYRMGPRLIRVDLAEVEALLRPIPAAGAGQVA